MILLQDIALKNKPDNYFKIIFCCCFPLICPAQILPLLNACFVIAIYKGGDAFRLTCYFGPRCQRQMLVVLQYRLSLPVNIPLHVAV